MIDITSFLLRHLYELMADNYNATIQRQSELAQLARERRLVGGPGQEAVGGGPANGNGNGNGNVEHEHEHERAQQTDSDELDNEDEAAPEGAQSDKVCGAGRAEQQQRPRPARGTANGALAFLSRFNYCGQAGGQTSGSSRRETRRLLAREQETNQQIVSFLVNTQLPDLACETLIELIFIAVFLAISWIFVMIVQLHCQPTAAAGPSELTTAAGEQLAEHTYQSARQFYCNTKFLNSLMYCNSKSSKSLAW